MLRNINDEIISGNFGRLDLVQKADDVLNIENSLMDTSGMFGTQSLRVAARNPFTEESSYGFTNLPPLPLNYIVRLEETFSDNDSVNFIFEFLQGNDLYWLSRN